MEGNAEEKHACSVCGILIIMWMVPLDVYFLLLVWIFVDP